MNFKNKIKNKFTPLAGLALLAVACSGNSLTEQLNGDPTQTNLGLKIVSGTTNTSALTALIEVNNVTVTAGQACVDEIRLKLPEGISCADVGFVEETQSSVKCEEEMEIEDGISQMEAKLKLAGPFLFDLVTGAATPSLEDVAIPSGLYREIEFRFDSTCGMGGETSIALEGSIMDTSNVQHSFEMELEFEDDLKIESTTDIQILENQINELFAVAVLNKWFEEIDFVDCVEDGDLVANPEGVIEINASTVASGSCEKIYEDVLDGIEKAFEFHDDKSGSDDVNDDSNSGSDDDSGSDDN